MEVFDLVGWYQSIQDSITRFLEMGGGPILYFGVCGALRFGGLVLKSRDRSR